MRIYYDEFKGILHFNFSEYDDCLISKGVVVNFDLLINNKKFYYFKTEFLSCNSLPDFRVIISSELMKLIIRNILNLFGCIKIVFKKLNVIIIFFIFLLFLYKIVLSGVYTDNLNVKKLSNLSISDLKKQILLYNSKEIYNSGGSSLMSFNLDSLKHYQNIKFIKVKNYFISEKNPENVKILALYYERIFLLKESFKAILPIKKCNGKQGEYYLYLINMSEKFEVILLSDYFNYNSNFSSLILPYDYEVFKNKENLCRIFN